MQKPTKSKKQNGFTLMELLIVLAIIGIMGSIAYNYWGGNGTISWGVTGTTQTRCVAGFKTNVSSHSSQQILDENGHGIPCKE